MKKFVFLFSICATVFCLSSEGVLNRIGTVNFRECVEKTKSGRQEQARFDQLKSEMEKEIEGKERVLKEMSPKFSAEYLESLTPEAEGELKKKFETLSQELTHLQNRYYQTLNQANMQAMGKLYEQVAEVTKLVGKSKGCTLVLNDEVCLYRDGAHDITSSVIEELDKRFDNNGQ